jgi:DNA-binding NtrC family response regulator
MTTFRAFSSVLNKPADSPRPRPTQIVAVIDDDPEIRHCLHYTFSKQYQVKVYPSAKAGVAEIDEDVCAVIIDVKMPNQDGFWACAEIRKKVPDMPVIFYSAFQNAKDPYAIINEFHPFGYVSKSDDIQKLADILDLAVKLQSMVVSNRKLLDSLRKSQSRR